MALYKRNAHAHTKTIIKINANTNYKTRINFGK